ncbi:MAG: hypothetical protein JSS49_22240 [Planctomycetes bacterium]|nr:hypothetical protein [Planctomycetota bacterium]
MMIWFNQQFRRVRRLHVTLRSKLRAAGLTCLTLLVWTAVARLLAAEGAIPKPSAEVRDVILMLGNGPLHVRLNLSVGKKSPAEARQETVNRLLKELDANADGKLSREEAQRSPLFREKQRDKAAEFIKSLNVDLSVSPKDIEKRIEQLGGETVVYRQNTEASLTDDQVFKNLDVDGDGIISEAEMTDAVDGLLAKDTDDDECVTLEEFIPQSTEVQSLVPRANVARSQTTSVAEIIRDTHQTLLPAQMIRKYDTDRNNKLSAAELNWTGEKLATCDADKDGQLSVKELANLRNTPVDLELAVDVIRADGERMLRVLQVVGGRSANDSAPDLVKVSLPTAELTFSVRDIDPFETSMTIALRAFNELDADKNGYLDKGETRMRERFGRGLFDQIDADGDGKIFGEEMKDFIRTRGEPVATTCHVTAFSDGAGFFSAIDTNGDRRLSVREMRNADRSLARMDVDQKPGLSEQEPVRQYRIEFVRGIFNPFGSTERSVNPPVATDVVAINNRTSVGPVWFQRWDRNNDGDITWREFLGPRAAFDELDADRDELIDPKEAEAASPADQFKGRTLKSDPDQPVSAEAGNPLNLQQ